MRRRRFQLRDLLQGLLQTLGAGLRRAHCGLELEWQDEVELDSYPGALEQVLTNLIQNALIHGLAGRTTGRLRIGFQARGEQVAVWVADDGVGMDDTTRARYFEPFFTTRLGQGGSGLGGYLVYNLVVGLLGGTVEIQSQAGHGTRVDLLLPCQAPEQTESSSAAYRTPPRAS